MAYETLFADAATYALPDGTPVQAIWSSARWVLPLWDGTAQYDVLPGERVVAVGALGETVTDLQPADFRLMLDPWGTP